MRQDPLLSIGNIAQRTGVAVSAIRYYADEGLLPTVRSKGGRRQFARSVIRRVSFILISQQMGYSLEQIQSLLASLPDQRTPTKADWQRLSQRFSRDIDVRIAELSHLKESLTGCIGCGCLSLNSCQLYNPDDRARTLAQGPAYLRGFSAADIEK